MCYARPDNNYHLWQIIPCHVTVWVSGNEIRLFLFIQDEKICFKVEHDIICNGVSTVPSDEKTYYTLPPQLHLKFPPAKFQCHPHIALTDFGPSGVHAMPLGVAGRT